LDGVYSRKTEGLTWKNLGKKDFSKEGRKEGVKEGSRNLLFQDFPENPLFPHLGGVFLKP